MRIVPQGNRLLAGHTMIASLPFTFDYAASPPETDLGGSRSPRDVLDLVPTLSTSAPVKQESIVSIRPEVCSSWPRVPLVGSPFENVKGFTADDFEERRQYLREFWSEAYSRKKGGSPRNSSVLPPYDMLEAIPADCDLTGAEKSFLFASICGLGPMFDLDPTTGRVVVDRGYLSPDFSLFDTCSVIVLERLSAWHWLQMYDDGLLEPTSNPSVLLSCLELNDRLQYLREMTSTKSVPWLEQARWFASDCLSDAQNSARIELLVRCDAAMALQLLESCRNVISEDQFLEARRMVIVLVLYFLGHYGSDGKSEMLCNFISHGLQAVRCVVLTGNVHQKQMSHLNLEDDPVVARGWKLFCFSLGVQVPPDMNSVLSSLRRDDCGGLMPVFLNPMALLNRTWSEISQHCSFRGYCMHPSFQQHRFPCRPPSLHRYWSVLSDRRSLPDSLRPLIRHCAIGVNVQRGRSSLPPAKFSLLQPSDVAAPCASCRHLRKLSALQKLLTRQHGPWNPTENFSTSPKTRRIVRQKLAINLMCALDRSPQSVPETNPAAAIPTSLTENHGVVPLANAGVLCFCQHKLLSNKKRNMTFDLFSSFLGKSMPTWETVEASLTAWWNSLCCEVPLLDCESWGYTVRSGETKKDRPCGSRPPDAGYLTRAAKMRERLNQKQKRLIPPKAGEIDPTKTEKIVSKKSLTPPRPGMHSKRSWKRTKGRDVVPVSDASNFNASDAANVSNASDAANVSNASDAANVSNASDAANVSNASDDSSASDDFSAPDESEGCPLGSTLAFVATERTAWHALGDPRVFGLDSTHIMQECPIGGLLAVSVT